MGIDSVAILEISENELGEFVSFGGSRSDRGSLFVDVKSKVY